MLSVSFYYVLLSTLVATAGAIMVLAGIFGKEPSRVPDGESGNAYTDVGLGKGAVYCILGGLALFFGIVGLIGSLLER